MKRWPAVILAICLLLLSAHALADADRFCDAMPEGLRELANRYTPYENYLDCILFTDTLPGAYCLVLSPRDLNGYQLEDGVWKIVTQVSPVEQDNDCQPYFRRHAAGAAPGMQGECGLTYPDDRGFDIVRTNFGYHNSLVLLLQYHWADGGFRLVGWQSGASGQFAIREDGQWAFFDSETGERLGGARIDRLAEYGLLIRYKDLPLTLEEALNMQAVTRIAAETLFPGWTMGSYWESGIGFGANAGYCRMDDGMLTIRRARLNSDAAGVATQTDTMPVPLSGALLMRLQSEDISALLDTSGQGDTFLTDDAFDRTKIPVTDTVLQNDLQSCGMMLLTEDANGVRRLRWVERDGEGYAVRSSMPLPDDAGLDLFHSGDGSVIVEWERKHIQCSFFRLADGSWTMGWMSNFGENVYTYGTVYCGVRQYAIMSSTDGILVGSHPWGDLFTIDFTRLPQSTEAMNAGLNRDGWAAVGMPGPSDRLPLRVRPDDAAESLGEFYNRTPARVLEQQGDWSRVRIGLDGRLEGWMRTEHLAFGSAIDTAYAPYWDLILRGEFEYHPLFASPAMRETTGVLADMDTWIVGVAGDNLYVLIDSDGNTGYLPKSWFGNGND